MEHQDQHTIFIKQEPVGLHTGHDVVDTSGVHMFIRLSDVNTAEEQVTSSETASKMNGNGEMNSQENAKNVSYNRNISFCKDKPEIQNDLFLKLTRCLEQETNKTCGTSCNSYNVATVTTKSSELPPFPLSLVMNHPHCKSVEIRLPLLHSSVDSNLRTTHTVIDEHGLLENCFSYRQPGTDVTVIVSPADNSVLQKLKDNIPVKELQHNQSESDSVENAFSGSKASLNAISDKKNIFRCAPENVLQDLKFLSQESTDNMFNKQEDFTGVDFYILPAGKILIGRTSSGEWLISCRKSSKHVQYNGNNCDIFQVSKHRQSNTQVSLEESCTDFKNLSTLNIQESLNKAESCSQTFNNITSRKGCLVEDSDLVNQTFLKEQSFLGNATSAQSENLNCSPLKPKGNSKHVTHQTVSILPKYTETQIGGIQVKKAVNEPQPVMMMRKEGNSLRVVQIPGNQPINDSESCKYDGDNVVKIKTEPVDTGYESNQSNSSTVQEDQGNAMVVRFPNLQQNRGQDTELGLNKKVSKSSVKRKSTEIDSSSKSRFIVINSVSTQPEVTSDQSTHLSDEQASSSMLMGDDSDSMSGLDDSETSRCSVTESSSSRFPVINDDERDALMDIESTRGTKKQTRWGVSTFREWLKERQYEPDFEHLPIEVLDERLEKFYAELRTSDGKLYATNSFRGIRASINRHLTSEPYKRPLSLFTDPAFHKSNKVFKAMMKKIKTVVVKKERPPPISAEDMHKLMTSNVLSVNTPKGLQNKVWLDLTLNFTYKNCPKQRDYKTQLFIFKTDEDGIEYVEIRDPNRSPLDVSPKMYATRDIYCPVASLMKYLTKRNTTSEDFFQQPRCPKTITDDNWYTSRPLGERQLSKMMENISKEAGLSRVYTNVGLKEVILKSLYLPVNTSAGIGYS